jgi:hypothetical protein
MSTIHFPAVGHMYEAHFGSWVHHLHFESETVMSLTIAVGPFKGTSETVQIAVTPIRSGVFMIWWQEANKTTVVHVGVITFFRPIFPAKQKEIRAGEEKEAFPPKICPSNTGRWTLIFGFPEQTVSPSVRSGADVHEEALFFGNAAEVIYFSSCLTGKMGRKKCYDPIESKQTSKGQLLCIGPAT